MTSKTSPEIARAAELIRAGGLVAFPTETVYGLGADATNDQAVAAIFKAKGRPSNNPLIIHVPSFEKLCACIDLSQHQSALTIKNHLEALRPLWPGPLSVVVPKALHISLLASAGGSTIGIRIPDHPVALSFLAQCDRPIAAPSANPSNYISPTTAQHVRDSLGDKVSCVIDGGACAVGIESTVLSLLQDPPVILRPGAITKERLEQVLGCPVVLQSDAQHSSLSPALSPGMLAKHYAPRTKVALLQDISDPASLPTQVGAIVFSRETKLPCTPSHVRVLSEKRDLTEIAANLFAALRDLDSCGVELILIETCEPVGLGAAIMDRLLRASR